MFIIDALRKVIDKKPVLFTTSGHSLENGILPVDFLKNAYKYDFSEIEGLDNLQNPEGVILESQKWASEVYGSGHSYYLINGSSSGILALMIAVASVGEKVLVARNAHKSVINALVLTGALPVWINTEWDNFWNIPTCVTLDSIKDAVAKNPDIKALFLTNPTYEGVVTDILPIVQFCKEKELILIVDEAHGALWNFSDRLPSTAISLGADASVQSLHKTASCLNQGSVLHLGRDSKIKPEKIQQALNIINTTSPSYLILASIEGSIEYLSSPEGKKRLDTLLNNVDNFRQKLSLTEKINLLQGNNGFLLDKTKLFFGVENVSGHTLGNFLLDENIEIELDNNKGVLAVTGIGTTKSKLQKLYDTAAESVNLPQEFSAGDTFYTYLIPKMVYTPNDAFYKKSKSIKLNDSIRQISKETIVPYPPGIPILIAGELVQQEHIDIIKYMDEIRVIIE